MTYNFFGMCFTQGYIYIQYLNDINGVKKTCWLKVIPIINTNLLYISLKPLCVLSCFTSVRLFVTPWTAACQAPLSMGFSRQE